MPLVKAQCTNCNGMLEIDASKDAAVCPHCGTPYVVEKAIKFYQMNIDKRTVNNYIFPDADFRVKNLVMADTMFENWLLSGDEKIKRDFKYYFPTDPRNEYINMWSLDEHGIRILNSNGWANLNRLMDLQNYYLLNDRFMKYWQRDRDVVGKAVEAELERRRLARHPIMGRLFPDMFKDQ